MTESNHRFPGFSIPEGAWLPPELLDILPEINTLSELKVTIAAIHETLRLDAGSSVISLTDFEALTGLDRKSVSSGISSALERGTVERHKAGNTYLYRLRFSTHTLPAGRGKIPLVEAAGRGKIPLAVGEEIPPNRGKIPPIGGEIPLIGGKFPLHVVMHDTLPHAEDIQHDNQRTALLAEMRQLGVALRIAQKLVDKYESDYLRQKLEYARHAVEQGLAHNGPGWFVTSVREDWQAPLGYTDEAKPKVGSEADRMRYIEGKYADLIQH